MADDETVTLDEDQLADRLRLTPEVAESLANRRVAAGRWSRWTAKDGTIQYRVPESDLAADATSADSEPTGQGGTGDTGAAESEAPDRAAHADDGQEPETGAETGSDPGDHVADLQEALKQYRRQRDEALTERDRLQEALDAARAERDELDSQRSALEAERDEALKSVNEASGNHEALRAKRDALQAEVDRLRAAPLRRAFARLFGRARI